MTIDHDARQNFTKWWKKAALIAIKNSNRSITVDGDYPVAQGVTALALHEAPPAKIEVETLYNDPYDARFDLENLDYLYRYNAWRQN